MFRCGFQHNIGRYSVTVVYVFAVFQVQQHLENVQMLSSVAIWKIHPQLIIPPSVCQQGRKPLDFVQYP